VGVTIRSVAKRAGVAVSTVSLALNGKPNVSREMRRKVLRAAEELDYHPHSVARNLANGRTKNISLINPVSIDAIFSSGFFSQLVKGMYKAAAERDYNLSLYIVGEELEAAVRVESIARSRSADGLVITNPTMEAPYIDRLERRDLPFVFIGRPSRKGISYVDNDNVGVGYMGVKHLIDLGHERIAFLTSSPNFTFCIDRLQGYRAAIEEAGIGYDEDLIWESGPTEESAYQIVSEALGGEEFSAIFATSDLQAMGAIRALREFGRRIPQDIAIVCVNNPELARHFVPSLTSIDLHEYLLGYRATKQLIQKVEGEDNNNHQHLIPAELIVRESCGCKTHAEGGDKNPKVQF
jgi:DNA-binding LacI/PurR family transcriptional regulator